MKCSAVNSNQNDLRRKTSEAEEGLIGLRDRAERAEEEVVRLQEKLTTEGGVAQVTMELSDKREAEVARLVDPDAKFHLGRKMPDTEVSVLHVACSARPGPGDVMLRIVKYLIKVGIIGLGWSNRI